MFKFKNEWNPAVFRIGGIIGAYNGTINILLILILRREQYTRVLIVLRGYLATFKHWLHNLATTNQFKCPGIVHRTRHIGMPERETFIC